MAGIDMSRLALAMLGLLSMLVLVIGEQDDNFHFLSLNDPPIITQQVPASPNHNTPPAIPSPIPIDTPIAFPSPIPIDTNIIPPPIFGPDPGLRLPKIRHCSSMCSKRCSLKRKKHIAHKKCLSLCNLKCMRGISDVVFDCTKNCADSKSTNFNPDAGNVFNFVNSCYEDCKKN